jgi:hypothetical protein
MKIAPPLHAAVKNAKKRKDPIKYLSNYSQSRKELRN